MAPQTPNPGGMTVLLTPSQRPTSSHLVSSSDSAPISKSAATSIPALHLPLGEWMALQKPPGPYLYLFDPSLARSGLASVLFTKSPWSQALYTLTHPPPLQVQICPPSPHGSHRLQALWPPQLTVCSSPPGTLTAYSLLQFCAFHLGISGSWDASYSYFLPELLHRASIRNPRSPLPCPGSFCVIPMTTAILGMDLTCKTWLSCRKGGLEPSVPPALLKAWPGEGWAEFEQLGQNQGAGEDYEGTVCSPPLNTGRNPAR